MNEKKHRHEYTDEELLSPRHLDILSRLRLIDDTFFAACFDNDPELTGFVLRIIMEKDDLKVLRVKTQYSIRNIDGHSAVLDALAADSSGKLYNIEVQRADRGALPQRARYNGSLIDSRFFPKGEDYSALPETCVIFLTEHDVLGDGRGVYHIQRIVAETGKPFGDGSQIIYANATHSDDSELGRLMRDFMCADPERMVYRELSEKTARFKKDKREVRHMCQIIADVIREERDDIFKRGLEQGMEKGLEKGRLEERAKAAQSAARSVRRMMKDGLPVERIAQYTELPVETVRRLAEEPAGESDAASV